MTPQNVEVLDWEPDPNPLRTCERLAQMSGDAIPVHVQWGKVYHTPEGDFRVVCKLGRGKEILPAFVERVRIIA